MSVMANTESSRWDGAESSRLTGARWWWASGAVLIAALAATLPTTGDLGLTWDEPAYRYSQIMSAAMVGAVGGGCGREEISRPSWIPMPYFTTGPMAGTGSTSHPPLAGQLNLATHAVFGRWVKDIPSRRLASVFEYALTIAIGFGFLGAGGTGPGSAG